MNFDEYIDRSDYPTMKWSRAFLAEHFSNADAIPMSVADMDMKAPPGVIAQLQKRVAHGIYGYEFKAESYFTALKGWYQNRHGWEINPQHMEPCPSILSAISILINQHSNEGDGVILQPPVFFEFRMVIKNSNRKIVKNSLKLMDGYYQIDFDDLEAKAADPANKVLILCNPHNPVGRVWTATDLGQVAEICERHDVFVIADEIHGDFAFSPHRYTPYLTVSDGAAQNGAACISPAKTFNISGMVDALTIIPNERHRQQFHEFAHRYQINKVNVFASAATEVAYRDGAEWLDALLGYIQGNVDLIQEHLQQGDMGISLIEPEGTFLAWLDFRGLGLDAKALEKFLAQDAQIALAPGYWFGREGAGFGRMTIGCRRETVQNALNSLTAAVKMLS
ncbi:MAG: pyridoxal phosphate-dependent aminotransferase [Ardenticatenaceae bacterium]|nr:pyridoxal phosphate-dependent aminotransferase [Anaerolineales bacterium]MCB8923460.1 pyridoxal phosphate-dependent aminotransferase [Ardenticatenaceae bacterium]MCB8991385.1 pyridoxal phosphate-dependent aminotransferase [Ardenticatenaceae bacterium]MCB9003815.1 pyridoxal phosphate-dependent aminotransferase [Ardenticatenaceae bacterium]